VVSCSRVVRVHHLEVIDASTVRATMEHGGIAASTTFTFDPNARLLEETAIRYNDARGADETWVNRNDSDREFGSVQVPASGDLAPCPSRSANWKPPCMVLWVAWRMQ